MSSFNFSNVALRAFAAATPTNIYKLDTSDRRVARYVKQMGVEQVHLSATEQTPVDLAYVALTHALAQVGWTNQDIDLVIFDTQGPDFLGGSGDSSLIHHYLNLREDCAVFDMTVGCSAFPYSLTVACSMMQGAEDIKRVALINGDLQWPGFGNNGQDAHSIKEEVFQQKHTPLFGECTGIVLLEKTQNTTSHAIKTKLFADGHGYKHLFTFLTRRDMWHYNAPYFILPDETKVKNICLPQSYMNGMAIHEFSTGKIVDCIKELYGKNIKNYDYYVFHQANKQILSTITQRLDLDPGKVLISLNKYGNTAAGTALTAICNQLYNLDCPAHIFNASFGVGLSWGFSDFVIEPGTVTAIIPTDHHFTEHCLRPIDDSYAHSSDQAAVR